MKYPSFNQVLCIHVVGAFLTFGWLSGDPCPYPHDFDTPKGVCGNLGDSITTGFFVSTVWPLYWDYKIFTHLRSHKP